MSLQPVGPFVFDFHAKKPAVVKTSTARMSRDTGLLLVRQFDDSLGFTEPLAEAIEETRDVDLLTHDRLLMVRQRIYGILADFADQNDHDALRFDPVFKLIADRSPDGDDLASQLILSRFENAVTPADLFRLRDVLVDQFIASFKTPPAEITLDIDAFDDPTHGRQQLTLFHGFYGQYQYLPLAVTCAENDFVVLVGLSFGTCAAFLGANDDLWYLVDRLRQVWPDVQIHVRGDCGFGVPVMYQACEELRIDDTFGIGPARRMCHMNPVLKRHGAPLLEEALAGYEQTGQKQRFFAGF